MPAHGRVLRHRPLCPHSPVFLSPTFFPSSVPSIHFLLPPFCSSCRLVRFQKMPFSFTSSSLAPFPLPLFPWPLEGCVFISSSFLSTLFWGPALEAGLLHPRSNYISIPLTVKHVFIFPSALLKLNLHTPEQGMGLSGWQFTIRSWVQSPSLEKNNLSLYLDLSFLISLLWYHCVVSLYILFLIVHLEIGFYFHDHCLWVGSVWRRPQDHELIGYIFFLPRRLCLLCFHF